MNVEGRPLSFCTLLTRWALAAGVCLVAGCGGEDKLPQVTGAVTINGKPVERGSISFIPIGGQGPTTGAEIVAGKYTSAAPPGESKVEIRVPRIVGKKKLYETADSPVQDIMQEVLPEKFNEKSELRFTPQESMNEKNWDLEV